MSAITWPGRRRGEGGAWAPRARARPPGSAYLADVLAHVLDDHLVGRDGLHGEQAPVVNVALAELELFLPELGAGRSGGVSPWSRARRPALAALRGGARPHLELVELEQVAVAAAGEGGQQAALLGAPLGARAGGRVRLRGDAHALGVRRGLIRAGAAAVEVSELVLLIDGVEALAAGTARHVLTDAIIPFLFLS